MRIRRIVSLVGAIISLSAALYSLWAFAYFAWLTAVPSVDHEAAAKRANIWVATFIALLAVTIFLAYRTLRAFRK